MSMTQTTKNIMKTTDEKGAIAGYTVLARVLFEQELKEQYPITPVRVNPLVELPSAFGDYIILLETLTPRAPVAGLEPVCAVRGKYQWVSVNSYSEGVAGALVEVLRKRMDVLDCNYTQQEK